MLPADSVRLLCTDELSEIVDIGDGLYMAESWSKCVKIRAVESIPCAASAAKIGTITDEVGAQPCSSNGQTIV